MAGVPQKLRGIGHYIKIANEYSNRDVAIQYWCLLFGVQNGMQIDKSSPDCKQFLTQNLSNLEEIKKQNKDNEAISNDIVASAHLEDCALKLFAFADTEDRAGRFNKNVVKAFYTAGYLFDILTLFGEVDSQIVQQQKYAKWKAAYIHNCLKNGETPTPGPVGGEEGFGQEFGEDPESGTAGILVPQIPPSSSSDAFPSSSIPQSNPTPTPTSSAFIPAGNGGSGTASEKQTADLMKAQKLCKYAISALEYEDVPTAVKNLQQALEMLQMGGN